MRHGDCPSGKSVSVNHLLVLAGGFGTRLRSVVSDVPKPLAPVMGQPYLHYMMDNWRAQGITRFTFLLHHQAELMKGFLQTLQATEDYSGCHITCLVEPQPMGTGGAIAYAVRELQLSGAFLTANADTWLSHGVGQVSAVTAPALAMVHVADSERYGRVMAEKGRVLCFEEKQAGTKPGWINAGLYHLAAGLFANWGGQPFSLERDLFPKLVINGELSAVSLDSEFIDIGIPADYFRFCRWVESGKVGAP